MTRKISAHLAAVHQPGQRRQPEPIEVIPLRPAAHLPAQHLVLLMQHQEFDLLGQIRPKQHHQQPGQASEQLVDQRQQHLEMVAATALIPQ